MAVKSDYHKPDFVAAKISAGEHRNLIGGRWEEIGALQLNYLLRHGLRREHRLLDIGCGALRGGVRFVRFLEPDHYYGVDINEGLIDVGYRVELEQQGLTAKLSRSNLAAVDNFDFSRFNVLFDVGLAFSVFTHLPFNDIRVCLERWAQTAAPGARLFATFFAADDCLPIWTAQSQRDGEIITYGDKDPYHYRRTDLLYLADQAGLSAEFMTDFDHPRGQSMLIMTAC